MEPVPSESPRCADAPVEASARLRVIDAIRGVAILGILPVNMAAFALPILAYELHGVWEPEGPLDRAARAVTHVFFKLKFYTIFCTLFGVGLYLQTAKSEERTGTAGRTYLRRLGWLAAIGLAHALLFWHGDVLFYYAIAGLAVFLLRHLDPGKLLAFGLAGIAVPIFCCIGPSAGMSSGSGGGEVPAVPGINVSHRGEPLPKLEFPVSLEDARAYAGEPFLDGDAIRAGFAGFDTSPGDDEQTSTSLHDNYLRATLGAFGPEGVAIQSWYMAHGSWSDVFALRLAFWGLIALLTLSTGFVVSLVGYMLLGVWLMKTRRFDLTEENAAFWRGIAWKGIAIAVPLEGISLWLFMGEGMQGQALAALAHQFSACVLPFSYIGLLFLFVKSARAAWLTRRLEATGRMALTNYLAQTVVMTTLFNGYGFGLFGSLGYAALLGIAGAMWIAMLLWSGPWLARFRFGPAEWLWRSLTYGKMQPMRK